MGVLIHGAADSGSRSGRQYHYCFFLMIFWFNQTEYKVLYSNLYQEDASRVVAYLEKEKVHYKFQASGSTILVPEDQVYNLRLALAGAGALHGQGMGFEILMKHRSAKQILSSILITSGHCRVNWAGPLPNFRT